MYKSQKVSQKKKLSFKKNWPLWLGLGTETRYQYGTGTYVTGMY